MAVAWDSTSGHSAAASGSNGSSATVAITAVTGETIILVVAMASAVHITSVTDTASNTWVLLASNSGVTGGVELWGVLAAKTSASITITAHYSASTKSELLAGQYTGVGSFGQSDANNSGTTSPINTSITIQDASNWVVGGGGSLQSNTGSTSGSSVLRLSGSGGGGSASTQAFGALFDLSTPTTQGSSLTPACAIATARQWQAVAVELRSASNSCIVSAGAASLAVTQTAPTRPGDTIVVTSNWASQSVTATISDTEGNTYQSLSGPDNFANTGNRSQVWMAANIKGGTRGNVITVALAGGSPTSNTEAMEFTGLAATPFDNIGFNIGPSGTVTTPTESTFFTHELVLGIAWGSSLILLTEGTGFYVIVPANGGSSFNPYVQQTHETSAGSYNASWTSNAVSWIGYILTLIETFTLSISESLVLTDSDIVEELGGSLVYELLDPTGSTIATGTAGSESITFSDAFAKTLSSGGALTETLSDTLTLSDGDTIQILGGSVNFNLHDGVTQATGTTGSEALALSDAAVVILGITLSFSDALSITDSTILGYSLLLYDALPWAATWTHNSTTTGSFVSTNPCTVVVNVTKGDLLLASNQFGATGVATSVSGTISDTANNEWTASPVSFISDGTNTFGQMTAFCVANSTGSITISSTTSFSGGGSALADQGLSVVDFTYNYGTPALTGLTQHTFTTATGSFNQPTGTIQPTQSGLLAAFAYDAGNGTFTWNSPWTKDASLSVIGYLQNVSGERSAPLSITVSPADFGGADIFSFYLVPVFETIRFVEAPVIAVLADDQEYNWADSLLTSWIRLGLFDGQQQNWYDGLNFTDKNEASYAWFEDVETFNWFDAFAEQLLSNSVLTESLSDSEAGNWQDSLILGYGEGLLTETLTISDSEGLGYGLIITDSESSNWQDSLILGYGEGILTETLTITDSDLLGYGLIIVDSESGNWADSLRIGYGEGVLTETLTITDSDLLGYGLLISDSLVLSDAFAALMSIALIVSDSETNNWADSLILGYGEGLFTETLTISDSNLLGYGLIISDTETLSDSLILGYGEGVLTETLTISSATGLGYGLIISDQEIFSDAFSALMAIALVLSDTETLSDSVILGYGEGLLTETLTISDSSLLGYGLVLSDSETLSDSTIIAIGMNEILSDSETLSDSFLLGYGLLISDSETISDSFLLGYGLAFTDTETVSDSLSLGYGFIIAETEAFSDSAIIGYGLIFSDTETLSDSYAQLLSIAETLSDSLTISDSLLIGYGLLIADSEVLSDSFLFSYGLIISDSETISDSAALGYGLLISDTETISDSYLQLLSIATTLSDSLTISDSFLLGYGLVIAETETLSDSFLLGYGLVIAETITLSDAFVLGYGLIISDSETLSDSVIVGYGLLFSDQETLSDSFALGYGFNLSDTETLSDSIRIGYGLLISDNEGPNWSDAFAFSTGGGINEQFSDSLVLSDAFVLGYGLIITDSEALSDSFLLGYGDLLTDSITISDAFAKLFSIASMFSETLTLSDSLIIGYGEGITTEQITISDFTGVGYGLINTESLSLSDFTGLGYGDIFSDSLTISDAFVKSLVIGESFSDTLSLTDSELIGYGEGIVTEQINISEFPGVGYGLLITDDESGNWFDSFVFNAGGGIKLTLSDQVSISETVASGYGNIVSDVEVITDLTAFTTSFEILIAEAQPNWLDALSALLAGALVLNDAVAFNEQMNLLYTYLMTNGEALTLAESSIVQMLAPFSLIISDSEAAAWFESVLTEFIFAPGVIKLRAVKIIQELIIESLTVKGPRNG